MWGGPAITCPPHPRHRNSHGKHWKPHPAGGIRLNLSKRQRHSPRTELPQLDSLAPLPQDLIHKDHLPGKSHSSGSGWLCIGCRCRRVGLSRFPACGRFPRVSVSGVIRERGYELHLNGGTADLQHQPQGH
uniref:Uncharacterized protein n=1 Tax=Felis catus TaxID=9685 RepID=A0ABI7Z008_FELCA